eukprot:CAMPEP_0201282936 /NCGR_PEP_ID=MMETSP1317-20130820/7063_1 /ASSEMBLY_ACC=CAM_ASM_000770 /TAXON_ID=187299 /ORGANISM="Undescribed Undescribed, Strain Undescribed" /LENGTH=95 /DNA_ID=CAMNT_0047597301 /DNA_START=1 /DNA_END=288 /DNA_ORIENTATION=+
MPAKKFPKEAKPKNDKKEKRHTGGGEKKKRKKTRYESFSIYLYKVLKQVHPEIGISKRSMGILNNFINDLFEKIMTESGKLVRYSKKRTLSSREV